MKLHIAPSTSVAARYFATVWQLSVASVMRALVDGFAQWVI